MLELGAVIGFFSPSNYRLPKKQLQITIAHLLNSGVQVAVAQIVRSSCKPEPLPAGVISGVWYSDHTLFYKENLWNLGAKLLPHENLLFIDSDVLIKHDNWAEKVIELLTQFDIVQPFKIAAWQNKNGIGFAMRRFCAAMALADDTQLIPYKHHPGFAWAMRRSAFDKLGGWYDFAPDGSGDIVNAFALSKQSYGPTWTQHFGGHNPWQFLNRKSFQQYRSRALAAHLKVGYCADFIAQHMWHGDLKNRKYIGREDYMPQVADGEYPLIRRDDGILEWANMSYNIRAQEYFDQRREDG